MENSVSSPASPGRPLRRLLAGIEASGLAWSLSRFNQRSLVRAKRPDGRGPWYCPITGAARQAGRKFYGMHEYDAAAFDLLDINQMSELTERSARLIADAADDKLWNWRSRVVRKALLVACGLQSAGGRDA